MNTFGKTKATGPTEIPKTSAFKKVLTNDLTQPPDAKSKAITNK